VRGRLTQVGYPGVARLHLVGHPEDGRDLDERGRDDLAVEDGLAEVACGLGAEDPPGPSAGGGAGGGGGGGVSPGSPHPAAPRGGGRHGSAATEASRRSSSSS
jgi:hypothetical protein